MSENLASALKMTAAFLIFIASLSVAIIGYGKVSSTSSSIMSNVDGIKVYFKNDIFTYVNNNGVVTTNDGSKKSQKINFSSSRIVGAEVVVPTLYGYFDNGYTVLFYETDAYHKDNNNNIVIDTMNKLPIYQINNKNLCVNIKNGKARSLVDSSDFNNDTGYKIYGLDLNDEQTRSMPWKGNHTNFDDWITCLINGKYVEPKYKMSGINPVYNAGSKDYILDYTNNGQPDDITLLSIDGKKNIIDSSNMFVERIGEYNYNAVYNNIDDEKSSVDNTKDSRAYQNTDYAEGDIKLSNDDYIENPDNKKKKVIQYIYIKNL